MDLYCQNCGEPYEMYHVYNDMAEDEKQMFLSGKGCDGCKGIPVKNRPIQAQAMSALQDILGDDVDGIASELSDFNFDHSWND